MAGARPCWAVPQTGQGLGGAQGTADTPRGPGSSIRPSERTGHSPDWPSGEAGSVGSRAKGAGSTLRRAPQARATWERARVPHGLQPRGQAECSPTWDWSLSSQATGPQSVSSPPGHWKQCGAWGEGHPGRLWAAVDLFACCSPGDPVHPWLGSAVGGVTHQCCTSGCGGLGGPTGQSWALQASAVLAEGAGLLQCRTGCPAAGPRLGPTVNSLGVPLQNWGEQWWPAGPEGGLWASGLGAAGSTRPGTAGPLAGSSTWPWPRWHLPRGVLPWPPSWFQPQAACLQLSAGSRGRLHPAHRSPLCSLLLPFLVTSSLSPVPLFRHLELGGPLEGGAKSPPSP